MAEAVSLPRFCGTGYVARLQRRGFETIGKGGGCEFEATVILTKPSSDAVLKVGITPSGDPWPLYAAWCLEHPGPFRPAIRSLRWHGAGVSRFFVASQGRLKAPNWGEHQPLIRALHHWYERLIAHGIDYRRFGDGENDPRPAKWLAREMRRFGLNGLARFVRELAATFPGPMLDPHPLNWMVTDAGGLVWIDPFSRTTRRVPETPARMIRPKRPAAECR